MEQEKLIEQLCAQRIQWAAQPTQGERFTVPRTGMAGVNVILHRPRQAVSDLLPVLFNLHGGAWIGGDAVLMESFCAMLAEQLPAMVVNVNYTKADVQPLPYAQYEVCDAIRYFAEHAAEYGIDPQKIAVGGHSAGAHIAAGVAILMKREGFPLACQMLVYPVVDMTGEGESTDQCVLDLQQLLFPDGNNKNELASPLLASDEALQGVCPALFIECGLDTLLGQGFSYAQRLMQLGVPVKTKEYPMAQHGFLEVNRPDYPADERQTPEQAAYCKDAEQWLVRELRASLDISCRILP